MTKLFTEEQIEHAMTEASKKQLEILTLADKKRLKRKKKQEMWPKKQQRVKPPTEAQKKKLLKALIFSRENAQVLSSNMALLRKKTDQVAYDQQVKLLDQLIKVMGGK